MTIPSLLVAPLAQDCGVVELRQYALHPGQRDVLIDLFERELVESQEAVGMRVIGQFTDVDRPDRFVWLRGFADMRARFRGLQQFYGGPVWTAHKAAANATMIDSDNVLLLRPAWPGAADGTWSRHRAVHGGVAPQGAVLALTLNLIELATAAVMAACREHVTPAIESHCGRLLAWYATETAVNDFVRLPVRENEPVLVALALFNDLAQLSRFQSQASTAIEARLTGWLGSPSTWLRLAPTPRSAIHA